MNNCFQAVIFDFDGTLVQSNQIKLDLLYDVARRLGPVDDTLWDILRDHPGADRFELYRRLLLRLNRPEESIAAGVDELCSLYAEKTVEAIGQAPEVPGAETCLRTLHSRQIPLYINSATPQSSLRKTVERRGWTPLFREVLGRPASKREITGQILERTGLAAHQVLFVGDSMDDLQTAREAGCCFVGIDAEPGWSGRLPPEIPVLSSYEPFIEQAQQLMEAADVLG